MRSVNYNEVILEPNNTGRAQLMPLGDMHIGYHTCNEQKIKECIDYAIKNHVYVLGMGDYLECGTRSSVGDSVYTQKFPITEQVDYLNDLFEPLVQRGLLIGLLTGNHELRVQKDEGADLTYLIAKILKVPYLGSSSFQYIKVVDQRYDAFATHGSSGAKTPATKLNSAFKLLNHTQVELVMHGHVHHLSHDVSLTRKIDRRNKCIKEVERHVLLTGHFLEYAGSYGEQVNLSPSKTGVAIVDFMADKHKIHISV